MNKQTFHINPVLRFRRWSRAGYAVFSSLACSVSIGVLSVSVSDKSNQKSGCVLTNALNSSSPQIDFLDEDGDASDLDTVLLHLQDASLLNLTFDAAPACTNYYFIFIIAVEVGLSHFNRFLFFI